MSRMHLESALIVLLAAALYAIKSLLSKLLLGYMPYTLMAGFLYIGEGIGMPPIELFSAE